MTREPGAVIFACENAERADTLLSKLKADLTWDSTLPLKPVAVAGVPGLAGEAWGVLVLARQGVRVWALSGATAGEVGGLVQRYGLNGQGHRVRIHQTASGMAGFL